MWAPTEQQKKVIRGGSWKDVAYFLQVSTCDYEYQDSARSYIIRTVQITWAKRIPPTEKEDYN
ncbi:MAG: hypothetical protein R2819_09805 [Allomuricauda sp.]